MAPAADHDDSHADHADGHGHQRAAGRPAPSARRRRPGPATSARCIGGKRRWPQSRRPSPFSSNTPRRCGWPSPRVLAEGARQPAHADGRGTVVAAVIVVGGWGHNESAGGRTFGIAVGSVRRRAGRLAAVLAGSSSAAWLAVFNHLFAGRRSQGPALLLWSHAVAGRDTVRFLADGAAVLAGAAHGLARRQLTGGRLCYAVGTAVQPAVGTCSAPPKTEGMGPAMLHGPVLAAGCRPGGWLPADRRTGLIE